MYNVIPTDRIPSMEVHSRDYAYVMKNLPLEVSKLIDYRLANPKALPSNHLLVKLLNSLSITTTSPDFEFIGAMEDRAIKIGNRLKMTTASNVGSVHKNTFYGNSITEVIVSVTDQFDLSSDWRKLSPIRVLSHPINSLNMDELVGEREDDEYGAAVIAVNIPMLAWQYRKWLAYVADFDLDYKPDMRYFLHTFPTLNMMTNHLNIAIFNRISKSFSRERIEVNMGSLSFNVLDYHDRLDKGIDVLIENLERKSGLFTDMLSRLPMLGEVSTENCMLKLIEFPPIPPLRQIEWSYSLAMVNYVAFLLKVDFAASAGNRNRQYISQIRRAIRLGQNDRVMRQMDSDLFDYYDSIVEYEIDMFL